MAAEDWRKPEVLALVLCDQIIRDEQSHKPYLLGVFSVIYAGKFPALHRNSAMYLAITNGRGKYQTQLRLVFAETEEELMVAEGQIDFRDPLQVFEVSFQLPPLPLPTPGKYRFDLLCDGMLCGSRSVVAQQMQERGNT
ncbi:MAG TPA: hypothetical protein VNE39_12570 [Planctomycetota bacterium]|nr:hypothetical protein [Planctomycetota bacterium]